ncbi:PLxRFG domain-containing protein [Ferrimonas balearica]|uniref:PLxRFG domain-containing protein n=1 Tax=Ferrimonas balearica TaxID=44012 RepID=UPI001C9594B3|nr:PLxRFG domain-containing protein [Ferrimonas balearica]MBY6105037.1 PLxRFG domain-containing protein [Ferrimonas balearica]
MRRLVAQAISQGATTDEIEHLIGVGNARRFIPQQAAAISTDAVAAPPAALPELRSQPAIPSQPREYVNYPDEPYHGALNPREPRPDGYIRSGANFGDPLARLRAARGKGPMATMEPEEEEQGILADIVDAAQHGGYGAIGSVADLSEQLFGVGGGFRKWADERRAVQIGEMSSAGREAFGKEMFTEDEEGDLTAGEGLTDWRTWALQVGDLAGQMAATMVPGAGMASGATKAYKAAKGVSGFARDFATRQAARRGITDPTARQAFIDTAVKRAERYAAKGDTGKAAVIRRYGQESVDKFQNRASIASYGALGGAVAQGQAAGQARQDAMSMSVDDLGQLEHFNELVDDIQTEQPGISHEQAREMAREVFAEEAAELAAKNPALAGVNLLTGAFGMKYLDDMLRGTKVAQTWKGRIGKGMAVEGTTEAMQEGSSQAAVNAAMMDLGVDRELGDGVAAAAATGGVIGAALGGMGGAFNSSRPDPEQRGEDAPPTDPETTPPAEPGAPIDLTATPAPAAPAAQTGVPQGLPPPAPVTLEGEVIPARTDNLAGVTRPNPVQFEQPSGPGAFVMEGEQYGPTAPYEPVMDGSLVHRGYSSRQGKAEALKQRAKSVTARSREQMKDRAADREFEARFGHLGPMAREVARRNWMERTQPQEGPSYQAELDQPYSQRPVEGRYPDDVEYGANPTRKVGKPKSTRKPSDRAVELVQGYAQSAPNPQDNPNARQADQNRQWADDYGEQNQNHGWDADSASQAATGDSSKAKRKAWVKSLRQERGELPTPFWQAAVTEAEKATQEFGYVPPNTLADAFKKATQNTKDKSPKQARKVMRETVRVLAAPKQEQGDDGMNAYLAERDQEKAELQRMEREIAEVPDARQGQAWKELTHAEREALWDETFGSLGSVVAPESSLNKVLSLASTPEQKTKLKHAVAQVAKAKAAEKKAKPKAEALKVKALQAEGKRNPFEEAPEAPAEGAKAESTGQYEGPKGSRSWVEESEGALVGEILREHGWIGTRAMRVEQSQTWAQVKELLEEVGGGRGADTVSAEQLLELMRKEKSPAQVETPKAPKAEALKQAISEKKGERPSADASPETQTETTDQALKVLDTFTYGGTVFQVDEITPDKVVVVKHGSDQKEVINNPDLPIAKKFKFEGFNDNQPKPRASRAQRLAAWKQVPNAGKGNKFIAFLSGKHSPAIEALAGRRRDVGLMVTPHDSQGTMNAAERYPYFALDNGVFGAKGFSPAKFRKAVKTVTENPAAREKLLFVVVPDHLDMTPDGPRGDADKTLELFNKWFEELAETDLPLGFVLQNGVTMDTVPWDKADVLFIGGDNDFKTGKSEPALIEILEEAQRREIPVHAGRVNTKQRLIGDMYELGHVQTVDGGKLRYGENANIPQLETWLDQFNNRGIPAGATKFPELGRVPTAAEIFDLAADPEMLTRDDLGAYEAAWKQVNEAREAMGSDLPPIKAAHPKAPYEPTSQDDKITLAAIKKQVAKAEGHLADYEEAKAEVALEVLTNMQPHVTEPTQQAYLKEKIREISDQISGVGNYFKGALEFSPDLVDLEAEKGDGTLKTKDDPKADAHIEPDSEDDYPGRRAKGVLVRPGDRIETPQGEYLVEAIIAPDNVDFDNKIHLGAYLKPVGRDGLVLLNGTELWELGYETEHSVNVDSREYIDEYEDGTFNVEVESDDQFNWRGTGMFREPEATVNLALGNQRPTETISARAADDRLLQWQDAARRSFRMENMNKTVISLFDSTGTWSQPWADAGFNVVQFDLNILGGHGWEMDLNDLTIDELQAMGFEGDMDDIYGILAACPCTDFAQVGEQHKPGKRLNGDIERSIDLVSMTKALVGRYAPKFWAVENPNGDIQKRGRLPDWRMRFSPENFGDPYSKVTSLWGVFNTDLPTAQVKVNKADELYLRDLPRSNYRAYIRSVTPYGMAYSFFMANGADRSLGLRSPEEIKAEGHKVIRHNPMTEGARIEKEGYFDLAFEQHPTYATQAGAERALNDWLKKRKRKRSDLEVVTDGELFRIVKKARQRADSDFLAEGWGKAGKRVKKKVSARPAHLLTPEQYHAQEIERIQADHGVSASEAKAQLPRDLSDAQWHDEINDAIENKGVSLKPEQLDRIAAFGDEWIGPTMKLLNIYNLAPKGYQPPSARKVAEQEAEVEPDSMATQWASLDYSEKGALLDKLNIGVRRRNSFNGISDFANLKLDADEVGKLRPLLAEMAGPHQEAKRKGRKELAAAAREAGLIAIDIDRLQVLVNSQGNPLSAVADTDTYKGAKAEEGVLGDPEWFAERWTKTPFPYFYDNLGTGPKTKPLFSSEKAARASEVYRSQVKAGFKPMIVEGKVFQETEQGRELRTLARAIIAAEKWAKDYPNHDFHGALTAGLTSQMLTVNADIPAGIRGEILKNHKLAIQAHFEAAKGGQNDTAQGSPEVSQALATVARYQQASSYGKRRSMEKEFRAAVDVLRGGVDSIDQHTLTMKTGSDYESDRNHVRQILEGAYGAEAVAVAFDVAHIDTDGTVEPASPDVVAESMAEAVARNPDFKNSKEAYEWAADKLDDLIEAAPDVDLDAYEKRKDAERKIESLESEITNREDEYDKKLSAWEKKKEKAPKLPKPKTLAKAEEMIERRKAEVAKLQELVDSTSMPDFGEIGHVTLDIPGNGKFKILNTKKDIARFKEDLRLIKTWDKTKPTTPSGKGQGELAKGPQAAVGNFMLDGEYENAFWVAESEGNPLIYGTGPSGSVNTYWRSPSAKANLGDSRFAVAVNYKRGRTKDGAPSIKQSYHLLHLPSGLTIGTEGFTKIDDAKAKFREAMSQERNREIVAKADAKGDRQPEFRKLFMAAHKIGPVDSRSAEPATKGLNRRAVQGIANRWLNRFPRAGIELVVTESTDRTKRATYHNGTVTLYANNLENEADVIRALRHELLGHHGLRKFVPGAEYARLIRQILATRGQDAELDKIWEQIEAGYDDYTVDGKAEEVFSHYIEGLGERGVISRVWDRVIATMRRLLVRAGLLKQGGTARELRVALDDIAFGMRVGRIKAKSDTGYSAQTGPMDSRAATKADAEVNLRHGDEVRAVFSNVASAVKDALATARENPGITWEYIKASIANWGPLAYRLLPWKAIDYLANRSKDAPNTSRFTQLIRLMDAGREKLMLDSKPILDNWRKLVLKNPKVAAALADLMHESTRAQVDPTQDSKVYLSEEDKKLLGLLDWEGNTFDLDDALARIAIKIGTTLTARNANKGGDGEKASNLQARYDKLKNQQSEWLERRKAYDSLTKAYAALPDPAKALYVQARDAYAARMQRWHGSMKKDAVLVGRADPDNPNRFLDEELARIRDDFEARLTRVAQRPTDWQQDYDTALRDAKADHARRLATVQAQWNRLDEQQARFEAQAPYFPLHRDGAWWAMVVRETVDPETGELKRDDILHFAKFQNKFQRDQAMKALRKEYPNLPESSFKVGYMDPNRKGDVQGVAKIVQALRGRLGKLAEAGEIDAKVETELNNSMMEIYFKMLPEVSSKKHMLGRKNRRGFSEDALKAFGSFMFHDSHQLTRFEYRSQFDEALEEIKEGAIEMGTDRANLVYEAAKRRLEWINAPSGSAWSTKATSFGFVWYLGLSPAAAMVNLGQTATVTLPYLASHYGWKNAIKALNEAAMMAVKNKGLIYDPDGPNTHLTAEEREAFKKLFESGTLTHTISQDLAGVADAGAEFSAAGQRTMEMFSFLFHRAEMFNRETTALAAIRLAKNATPRDSKRSVLRSDQAAREAYAVEVIEQTHFDYSSTNRSELMQNDILKVMLLFRQYSINMMARMIFDGRDWIANADLSKEERQAAKTRLLGVLGTTAMVAGGSGLPLYWLVEMLGNALFDDEDEPWDTDLAIRKHLTDLLGADAAGILHKGAVGHLTGLGVSNRMGLNNLFFMEDNRSRTSEEQFNTFILSLAGPVAGIGQQIARGSDLIEKGHIDRGVEYFLPKALRDVMKGMRYHEEGATSLRGDPILEDMSILQAASQAIGFMPHELAEQYDVNMKLKGMEYRLKERRSLIMDQIANGIRFNDPELLQKGQANRARWNELHPAARITHDNLESSLKSRARYDDQMQNGVVFDKRYRHHLNETWNYYMN